MSSSSRLKPESIPVDTIRPFTPVDINDSIGLRLYRTSRKPALICTADAPPRVLLGLNALASARRRFSKELQAWRVECDEEEAEQIAAADLVTCPRAPDLIKAVALLRAKHVPSVTIASALGLKAWDISRMAAADKAGERLSGAVAKGLLPLAHTRLLSKLPAAEQTRWTEKAIAGHWSYRKLEQAMRDASSPTANESSPDLGAFTAQLAERLGTEVQLDWPDDPAKRRLTLSWYGPEDLKGLFAKLAAGPDTAPGKPIRREFVLPLATIDELDALTAHLVQL